MSVQFVQVRYLGQRPASPQPGDYWRVNRDEHSLVILCCPGCGNLGDLSDHTIHLLEPLTVEPSVICDQGCHYFIANGQVRWA